MNKSIEEKAADVLAVLAEIERNEVGNAWVEAEDLDAELEFDPPEINDVVELLVHSGYAEWQRYMGTAPYKFGRVQITPAGRFELEHARSKAEKSADGKPESGRGVRRSPLPQGSPYGFEDEDWEQISERKDRTDELRVVFGYQFNSEYYEADALTKSVNDMFSSAVEEFNSFPDAESVRLIFEPLAAGYGEHLFNEIARAIISSDIAVFETSDLNPNVMLEMGVALTWGVRVLPIKRHDRPRPPSDISGQTWADYRNSGSDFLDSSHQKKLVRMVEGAARKKG